MGSVHEGFWTHFGKSHELYGPEKQPTLRRLIRKLVYPRMSYVLIPPLLFFDSFFST